MPFAVRNLRRTGSSPGCETFSGVEKAFLPTWEALRAPGERVPVAFDRWSGRADGGSRADLGFSPVLGRVGPWQK